MFNAFSTALSALSAFSTAVDVVGNNLANLNTTGFKASTVTFHDLVTQSIGDGLGETQVGFGVDRPTTLRQFTQGSIQPSNGTLDMAIQGDGFLVIKTAEDKSLFTRAGNLQVDRNGLLLTATHERVQGWTNSSGRLDTSGPIGDIAVPVGTVRPPSPSSAFSFNLNLNAGAAEGDTFSTSITVYDSLGASHVATIRFTRTDTANEWDYAVTLPDGDFASPVDPLEGTLTFNEQGQLEDPAPDDEPIVYELSGFQNGAADLSLTWSLFDGVRGRLTQFNQPSAVSALTQDGSTAAQLERVGIADGGLIFAQYSDGKQTVVGQVAMAAIRNPESLIAVGNNNYQLSAKSALPAIGVPGTGGRGMIIAGSVESSTVDIAKEFTNLIVLQRGYQANAKIVSTVDELSQETLNLKR